MKAHPSFSQCYFSIMVLLLAVSGTFQWAVADVSGWSCWSTNATWNGPPQNGTPPDQSIHAAGDLGPGWSGGPCELKFFETNGEDAKTGGTFLGAVIVTPPYPGYPGYGGTHLPSEIGLSQWPSGKYIRGEIWSGGVGKAAFPRNVKIQ